MAPEQADPSRGPITPRTDVYGLGGLLYALLTGKPPIQGDSITQLLARVVSPEPVASPRELRIEVPAALERICLKCLSKEPDQRYATARDVLQALEDWRANPERGEIEARNQADARDRLGSRREWTPDRSLNDDRRLRNKTGWPPKASLARLRGRGRVLAASALTLTLLLVVVVAVPALRLNERMTFKGESHDRPTAPGTGPPGISPSSPEPTSPRDLHAWAPPRVKPSQAGERPDR